MHGLVFGVLKKYVVTKLGEQAWGDLLEKSELGSKQYFPISTYPDAEAVALVTTASKVTGLSPAAILEDFGTFMVPDLFELYRHLVKPEWKTLDLIENTESLIHSVVRIRNKGALPPALKTRRVSPTELVLTYGSARKMCFLARGISKGLADHYAEKLEITEPRCMHRGAAECELVIRTV